MHSLSSGFNSNWMAITLALDSLARILLYASTIEFFVSQTPYSITNAVLYERTHFWSCMDMEVRSYSLSSGMVSIAWPFTHLSINWGPGVISCEFWYLLLALLIITIFSGLFLIIGKWYVQEQKERRCATKSTHLR